MGRTAVRRNLVALRQEWFSNKLDSPRAACEGCKRQHNLTLDHIVPLMLIRDMGFEEEGIPNPQKNWRILCRICNNQKSGHLDFNDSRTKPLLLELINQVEDLKLKVELKESKL